MKLKIIKYDGTKMIYDVKSFEFRSNQVTNWINLKFDNNESLYIHDVCVIKVVE